MIFDPRGQLTPFTMRARVLFQEACVAGYGWNEQLNDDDTARWKRWLSELPELVRIHADRCFKNTDPDPTCEKTEVHTFVDASDAATAATCCVRSEYPDGRVKVTLAYAKSRPTPIKKLSIPKPELNGAVLGVQLSKELEAALKIPLTEHRFWTASLNVLYWLRSHSRRFSTDIGVKISEIQRATSPLQWQHVPGKINPADLYTRGMPATSLATSSTWWTGPEFLSKPSTEWPQRDITVPSKFLGETKRHQALTFVAEATVPRLRPENFSSATD
ncbi:uncharacterized protein LOC135829146 [Sycon ciliatum]|uniref:uncharacterized protein LOC135829146 n=1 Tax=Sycon ciliatum TaxID=27933 RepID=UPI0031F60DD5